MKSKLICLTLLSVLLATSTLNAKENTKPNIEGTKNEKNSKMSSEKIGLENQTLLKKALMKSRFKASSLKNVDFEFERRFNSILSSAQQSQHDDDSFGSRITSQDNLQQIEEETYRKVIESDVYSVAPIMSVDISRSLDMSGSLFNGTLQQGGDARPRISEDEKSPKNVLVDTLDSRTQEATATSKASNDNTEKSTEQENSKEKEKKIPVFLGGTQPLSENQKSPTFMPILKGKSTNKALNGKNFHELDYVKEKKIKINTLKTHNSTQVKIPSGYYGTSRITY